MAIVGISNQTIMFANARFQDVWLFAILTQRMQLCKKHLNAQSTRRPDFQFTFQSENATRLLPTKGR